MPPFTRYTVYLVSSSASTANLLLGNTEKTHRSEEYFSLLIESATNIDPRFIIEEWIEKVTAANGAVNRRQKSIEDYRSIEFDVHSQDDFKRIKLEYKQLVLPPQTPHQASKETKDA